MVPTPEPGQGDPVRSGELALLVRHRRRSSAQQGVRGVGGQRPPGEFCVYVCVEGGVCGSGRE